LLFCAPQWPPITPPGLLRSLSPSLLASILHRTWSIGMNLSLDLHRMSLTITSHPTPAHHEWRETSNPHNVVNRSSSKDDHHWSSVWIQITNFYRKTIKFGYRPRSLVWWYQLLFYGLLFIASVTCCFLALLLNSWLIGGFGIPSGKCQNKCPQTKPAGQTVAELNPVILSNAICGWIHVCNSKLCAWDSETLFMHSCLPDPSGAQVLSSPIDGVPTSECGASNRDESGDGQPQ
jgi:hypothetical protein